MSPGVKLVIVVATLLLTWDVFSRLRATSRAERAARQRKRELNESLVNRRLG
jgi:hypothetical protein